MLLLKWKLFPSPLLLLLSSLKNLHSTQWIGQSWNFQSFQFLNIQKPTFNPFNPFLGIVSIATVSLQRQTHTFVKNFPFGRFCLCRMVASELAGNPQANRSSWRLAGQLLFSLQAFLSLSLSRNYSLTHILSLYLTDHQVCFLVLPRSTPSPSICRHLN